MQKRIYETPDLETVIFTAQDVLASSGGFNPDAEEAGGWNAGEMGID